MAHWCTKAAISLKRVKIEKSYYGGPIGTHQRSFELYHPRPPTASPSSRLGFAPHRKRQSLLSHERVKPWTSNLAYTHRGHPNKKPLKIFEKREHGRIQGLPILGYPLLSQERVKRRTSNFADTFKGILRKFSSQ